MQNILIVGLGGFIGSVTRYKLGELIFHMTDQWRFPCVTLAVNLLGCMVVGVLACIAERHNLFGQELRLSLFTGLLGGFTTFSAFGLAAMHLIRRGDLGIAALYVGASVLLGIIAVWLGFKLAAIADAVNAIH